MADTPLSKPDEMQIQGLVTRMCQEALTFYEESRQYDEVTATDYYMGRPFGAGSGGLEELEGRSQVVSRDVHDVVHAQLPSLLRIFAGPERVVKFRPRGPEDEQEAHWKTEYINYVVWDQNDGFLKIHSILKDALVRRIGVAKWWWETGHRIKGEKYTGLSEQGLQILRSDPEVDQIEVEKDPKTGFYAGRVTRKEIFGYPRFEAVPPDEFLYTPDARCQEDAPFIGHSREAPIDELVMMGYDRDLILEHAGDKESMFRAGTLQAARQVGTNAQQVAYTRDTAARDKSQELTLFTEAYCLIDVDGDGVAERRLFHCIGPDFYILPDEDGDQDGEIVDDLPFATFLADPEPHTMLGLSTYDNVQDIQKMKSQILRGMFNSLALSLDQKTEVVSGKVNIGDLISPEIAGIVRVEAPGQMREITHTFMGPATLPALEYVDEMKENRTGISKAAAGLDADSLQSATKAAVAATLSSAQQHLELLARVLGETGFRRLYKGLARLCQRNQDVPTKMKLYGASNYQEVDPRDWRMDQDVIIDVGIGQGAPEDRIQSLAGILQIQKELLAAGAPLVSYVELRKTLQKAVELAGWRNSTDFFKPWGPKEDEQYKQQMAQMPQKPDPELALAQIESEKAQADFLAKYEQLAFDRWKAILDDRRERDLAQQKNASGIVEQEIKSRVDLTELELQKEMKEAEMAEAGMSE